jgi:hypothetical protein
LHDTVGDASNFLSEDVNDAVTNTSVHASAGTSGESGFYSGCFKGGDGHPATDANSFKIIAQGQTGTHATNDLAFYVADKLGGLASAITVTWNATDENASHYLEWIYKDQSAPPPPFIHPKPIALLQAVNRASTY